MSISKAIGLMGYYFFAEKFKNHFVAGSTLQDAINRAKFYQSRGEKSVINVLGEHAKDHNEANKFCEQILELIALLAKEGLGDVHIAEKPSQIGLDVSEDLYRSNKLRILKTAAILLPHTLIETDAEDHFYRKRVLRIAMDLNKYFSNQLLCCQVNHYGAIQEIEMLHKAGIPVRVCKGNAYKGDIENEEDLRGIYLDIASMAALRGIKSAFATHDLFLIDLIAQKIAGDKNKFEFNLLMGIEGDLYRQEHLKGFSFRRYIPCDPNNNWRPYAKRRAEAIVNIWFRNWLYRIGRRRK